MYKLARGRQLSVDSNGHRRRYKRSKADYWGACVNLGTLEEPVNDWPSISQHLDAGTRGKLLRLALEPAPRHRPCSLPGAQVLSGQQSGRRRVAPVALFEPDA